MVALNVGSINSLARSTINNTYNKEVSEQQMIDAIRSTIYQIETWDTTTVRASTPMLELCKFIKRETDTTVIFSGEGSDEASGSYMYFHNAPSPGAFLNETKRLMTDLCYFDVLRCDRSTAGAGLEVRVPFLDKEFLRYYMSIDPRKKMTNGNIEKFLLRKAFDDGKLLPKEVLWRVKEGMSDGVSSQKKGWFEIIQEKADSIISDEELANSNYTKNKPKTKESLWFRNMFNEIYNGQDHVIPYYWLPKWSGDVVEASARVLNCYSHSTLKEEDTETLSKY